jgi:hypothetical protein
MLQLFETIIDIYSVVGSSVDRFSPSPQINTISEPKKIKTGCALPPPEQASCFFYEHLWSKRQWIPE